MAMDNSKKQSASSTTTILQEDEGKHIHYSPGMMIAKFQAMKTTAKLPSNHNFQTQRRLKVKVWTNADFDTQANPPYPLFQNFAFPIKSINFIPAEESVLESYDILLVKMNLMYSSLTDDVHYKCHVLAPERIIAGDFAIAKILPSRPDLQISSCGYGDYHRVQILESFHNQAASSSSSLSVFIRCYCIDQGNVAQVDFRHLFIAKKDFASLPPKVIQVPLRGLASYSMKTQLRQLLRYESYLDSTIFTLSASSSVLASASSISHHQKLCGINIESSKYPGRSWIKVLKSRLRAADENKTSYSYRKESRKAIRGVGGNVKNVIIPFSSLVPIRSSPINFGCSTIEPSSSAPAVHLALGSKLDLVVIGFSNITPSQLTITPSLSVKNELLKPINNMNQACTSSSYFFSAWAKQLRKVTCPCIKDGQYFLIEYQGSYYRGRLMKRKYRGFMSGHAKDINLKKVDISLVDLGQDVVVPGASVSYLPLGFGAMIPGKAVAAFWECTNDNGEEEPEPYKWTEEEWNSFCSFILYKRLFGVVHKMRQDDESGVYIVHLDLYNPKTNEKLTPGSRFWMKKNQEFHDDKWW